MNVYHIWFYKLWIYNTRTYCINCESIIRVRDSPNGIFDPCPWYPLALARLGELLGNRRRRRRRRRPSVRPPVRPSARPSVRLSVCPPGRPSVRPPVRPSVRPNAGRSRGRSPRGSETAAQNLYLTIQNIPLGAFPYNINNPICTVMLIWYSINNPIYTIMMGCHIILMA